MLKPGDKAPDFSLPDADMNFVEFKQLKGKKNIVLYFYVRDDTTNFTTRRILAGTDPTANPRG